MSTFAMPGRAVRATALVLAVSIAAGCAGGSKALLPASPGASQESASALASAPSAIGGEHRRRIKAKVRIRIPRRHRERARALHPASISALTQSVSIAVDGGTAQTFNTTPTSPGCSAQASGIVCTFAIDASVGTDTFVITTWTQTGGIGTPLDRGTAQIPIAAGKANAIALTLGPVVSTELDSGVGSLRYAIGTANAGDTIVFMLAPGSVISLASEIQIVGNVNIAGPGVAAGNITISGGGSHTLFDISGTATISGLILSNGQAPATDSPGGAITNTGSLTLASNTIENSTSLADVRRARSVRELSLARIGHLHPHCTGSTVEGGAIYNDGTLVSSGNTYMGNTVSSTSCGLGEGGAIFNDALGALTSSGDTFAGNGAQYGGGVFNASNLIASFTGDTFKQNFGCTATLGCPTVCTTTCTSFAEGEGSAIADTGLVGITVTSSTFTGNVAGGPTPGSVGEGAALALAGGTPTVTGSTFTDNAAGGSPSNCGKALGGAIAATIPIEVDSDTFTGNTADSDGMSGGGAIYNATGTTTGTNDTFTQNQTAASGSACAPTGNVAGGAVASVAAAEFTNSTFSQNSATANGMAGGGAVGANGLTLIGDTFTSNTVAATGALGAMTGGGGGAALSPESAVISGSTFTGNTATIGGASPGSEYGGAVEAGSTLVSSGNVYTSNAVLVAAGTGGAAMALGGAAADYNGTTAFISNDTYKDNSVTAPGGGGGGALVLVLTTSPLFVVSNSTFTGNTAGGTTLAEAGALGINAPGEVIGSTFTSNSSATTAGGSAYGGAYFDAGNVVLTDSTFSQNSTGKAGGALYVGDSDVIENSLLTGNAVTAVAGAGAGGGGGIYADDAITVTGSTISNNAVTVGGAGSGGGGGGIFNSTGLTLGNSTISGNSVTGPAPATAGGGILNLAGAAIENSTIARNTSAGYGGGIYNAVSDTYTYTNATIYQNSATGSGGNIYNPYTISLENTIVAGGSAASGADIFNTGGTITSDRYNIIQTSPAGGTYAPDPTDQVGVNPQLLALANNGGPTFTNADTATSPGTAHIPYAGGKCGDAAIAVDQRGYTRGNGGFCDVGAFEFNGTASAIRRAKPHVTRKATVPSHGLIGVHGKARLPLLPW